MSDRDEIRNAALEEAATLIETTNETTTVVDAGDTQRHLTPRKGIGNMNGLAWAAGIRALKSAPAAQSPGEVADVALPPLPPCAIQTAGWNGTGIAEYFTADQMRAYALADRQQRGEGENRNTEQERAEFEAWASDEGKFPHLLERVDDYYRFTSTQYYWAGWQARAALAAQPAVSAEPSDEEIITQAKDWCDDPNVGAIVFTNHGDCIAFARALLSRYGRPAGDAQPVEHGPWIKSTLKEYEGQCYCGKCCVMFEYRDRRPCISAPVAAQKADDAKLPAKLPEYESAGGEYPSNDSYQEGYTEGWNAAIDAAIAQQGKPGDCHE